ncbi:HTH domain-containing protein [Blautia sp. RD014234]|nr:HTH domain-containing protein [Blautia parvula]
MNEKQQNVRYIMYFIGEGKITAQEQAEYFEVSVRTIHRDLLDLSSAGFPVTTNTIISCT